MRDNATASGRYSVTNNSPLRVDDPEKFIHLCDILGFARPSRIDRGIVTAKEWRAMVDLDAFKAAEIDKLLHGGRTKWTAGGSNIVVDGAQDYLLDVALSGATQLTAWYLGLLGSSPSPLETWTISNIAAVDFVNYDESVLQTWTDGGVTGQSVSNSASVATFTCSTDTSTIGGAFLTSNSTKATPAGTLYSAAAFSGGNESADDGDTIDVTGTYGMSAG